MNYFTVEITLVNGTTAQAIYRRDDMTTALSAFHSFMASSMANTNCTSALCMIIDSDGGIYKKESWMRT